MGSDKGIHRRIVSTPADLGRGGRAVATRARAVTDAQGEKREENAGDKVILEEASQPVSAGKPKGRRSLGWLPFGRTPSGHQPIPASPLGVVFNPHESGPARRRLGAHLAPLLGPLFGVRTTETTEAIFAQMQEIHTRSGLGSSAEQLADHFDLERLKLTLLRRDGAQTGGLDTLALARVERAFESILTTQVVETLPRELAAPIGALGAAMAEQLRELTPKQNEQVIEAMVEDLQREHPRPWSDKVPLLARLCERHEGPEARREAVLGLLAGQIGTGEEALGAMVVMRSVFLGLKAAGLDSTRAPWLKDADRDYMAHILLHKGRFAAQPGFKAPRDAIVGITALGMASPVASASLRPGVRAATAARPNFELPAVEDAIRAGNPYASGISGTTNMFLHAASYFNAQGQTSIDGPALATALAALLCYDGGHSIHEVYMVANLLRELPGLDLEAFRGYAPGHARGTFVDLAAPGQPSALAEASFEKLLDHFRGES